MTALDVITGTVLSVTTSAATAPVPADTTPAGTGAAARRPADAGLEWDDARALTDTAREAITSALEWADVAAVLILRAKRTHADVVLGYPAWADYVRTEFAGVRDLRLPVERRQAIVAELRAAGLVLRDIAEPLGISERLVRTDLLAVAATQPPVEQAPAALPAARKGPAPRTRVQRLLGLLDVAGTEGRTARELRRQMRDVPDPGAILSELHARHVIQRLSVAEADGTRDGFAVYVLTEHVAGREVEGPGRRSRRRVVLA